MPMDGLKGVARVIRHRQVWEVTRGPSAGARVMVAKDGDVRLVRKLDDDELVQIITHGGLTPLRPDACQDPFVDLLRRRHLQRLLRSRPELRAI